MRHSLSLLLSASLMSATMAEGDTCGNPVLTSCRGYSDSDCKTEVSSTSDDRTAAAALISAAYAPYLNKCVGYEGFYEQVTCPPGKA